MLETESDWWELTMARHAETPDLIGETTIQSPPESVQPPPTSPPSVQKGKRGRPRKRCVNPATVPEAKSGSPAEEPAAQKSRRPDTGSARLLLTGGSRAGKDFLADTLIKAGWVKLGFSEPIRHIAKECFNQLDRRLLQAIGEWLRGSQYDLVQLLGNAGYQEFIQQIRTLPLFRNRSPVIGHPELLAEMVWESAKEQLNAQKKVVVVGARTAAEVDYFRARGFQHWHVMAAFEDIIKRMLASNIDPGSFRWEHPAEKFCSILDAAAWKLNRRVLRETVRANVIWNSDSSPPIKHWWPAKDWLKFIIGKND